MSGHSLWSFKLPVGYISYEDGLLIRNMEASENMSAMVKIPAKIEDGVNYNVVGKLRGSTNPDKTIIISGHYDTVMDAGFCDNGAGTSGIIELARVFVEAARTGVYTPEQTLVFIAFTGEELGFVGAMNYVRQHKAEMKDITAVINLDCIGQGILTVSETVPDEKGIQLDEIVLKAAEDLGVPARSEDPGGSDQEAFGNPVSANILYYQDWGLDGGINDSARVISSIMLCSYPLFYSDIWVEGTPGWAHTAYDNSTSTTALNWVTVDKLEGHTRVAAVSVMRFLAEFYNPFMSEVIMGSAIAAVVVLIAAILERSKVKAALTKVYSDISSTVDAKEIVYIIILTALFLFSSYALTARIVKMETIIGGVPQIVSARDFGYPFEMIRIPVQTSVTTTDLETALSQLTVVSHSSTLIILWEGLLLDIVLYFVLAFVVVYLLASISYRYSVGRMSETE
jgi:carboxypeptidase Q